LPPVAVGGNEVVGGAVIVGAEEDDDEEEDGDENGDEDVVVVPEAVVSSVVAAVVVVFCVKSIVRRTGWHISAAGVPASIADAHNCNIDWQTDRCFISTNKIDFDANLSC
jgi:hypothetical protein